MPLSLLNSVSLLFVNITSDDELGFNGLSGLLGYIRPSPRERGMKDTDQSGITLLL